MNTTLLHAILEKAIDEFVTPMTKAELEEYGRMVREEAGLWLMDSSKALGSFRWVCKELGIDPNCVLEEVVDKRVEADYRRSAASRKRAKK